MGSLSSEIGRLALIVVELYTENFFRVKVTQKLSHACPNFDAYTLSQFHSFKKMSQIDSNSTMTQLLSQIDSKKLALFLVTQFPSQLTKKQSHDQI